MINKKKVDGLSIIKLPLPIEGLKGKDVFPGHLFDWQNSDLIALTFRRVKLRYKPSLHENFIETYVWFRTNIHLPLDGRVHEYERLLQIQYKSPYRSTMEIPFDFTIQWDVNNYGLKEFKACSPFGIYEESIVVTEVELEWEFFPNEGVPDNGF